MKTEFDLNNLTDADVEFLEEALSRRRLMKLDTKYIQRGLASAMSAGFRPHEINAFIAPNYGNIDRSVFAGFRQTGKSSIMTELLKPYLELKWDYSGFVEDQIDEEHEQYNAVFNQFRRSKYLPSIELKIGNLYELKLGEIIKKLYLVRIDGNIKHFPELYFSENTESSRGSNISVYKIMKEIK